MNANGNNDFSVSSSPVKEKQSQLATTPGFLASRVSGESPKGNHNNKSSGLPIGYEASSFRHAAELCPSGDEVGAPSFDRIQSMQQVGPSLSATAPNVPHGRPEVSETQNSNNATQILCKVCGDKAR